MPFKALVIGGTGGMGRWCAAFLKKSGFAVAISSRRDATAAAAALGVGAAKPAEAGQFDVVVLAVPLDAVAAVAADVGPRLRPGSLLMDLSSLKKGPMAAMEAAAGPGVEVLGMHPLFGPGLTALEGRTVVLVPSAHSDRWLPLIKDLLESAGARVTLASAEEHDRRMSVVQGLTHFMYIAWGRALLKLALRPEDFDGFETPVFGATRDLAGRVLAQSPGLYAQIQCGDETPPVRSAFLDACRDLAALADAGDARAFEQAFAEAAAGYGDTEAAWLRSERLLRAGDPSAISRGAERAFALPDGRQVYGFVREARREDFTLETPSETLVLRYDSVVPLGPDGLGRLKGGSPRIGRDLLVKLPIGADARVLRDVLLRIDGVTGVAAETLEAGSPDHTLSRFTVDVSPDRSEEALQRVLLTIWGLGLEVK